ncbi:hotdog fold thioesterase [Novosphingobium sp.]|uniref:hotdog fold thioesterase n=1 Tax=Novosphingobium sp. TaxID=1874826 RepID=UPI002B4AABB7|nr:hotdog fold thioesterase [Novosphingobium sp.]HKR92828.1 hotdog fold thioesterase [Novosphingobium sp.]
MTQQDSIWHGTVELAALNRLGENSMNAYVGIEFIDFGDDWLAARLPVDKRTVQPFGRLHGGASVVLAETVASVAAMCTLDPTRETAVGMEINANHLRPVSEGYVHAVARPEALQRKTQVWSIRITDELGRLVCISRITMAVIPVSRAAPA